MRSIFFAVVSLLLLFVGEVSGKIRILTFQYNHPDFLEMQINSLKKYMLNDYELIVFLDAKTPEYIGPFREICDQNQIRCVQYQPEWHDTDPLTKYVYDCVNAPSMVGSYTTYLQSSFESVAGSASIRHCHLIQYALDHYGYNHEDIVVIMDHDIFPIRELNLREFMGKNQMIGSCKSLDGIKYMWVPFVAIDMRTIPNKRDLKFHCDVINNIFHDTGANSYYYLKNNPKAKVKKFFYYSQKDGFIPEKTVNNLGFTGEQRELITEILHSTNAEFHIDFHFLHFSGAWRDDSPSKTQIVKKFIDNTLLY
ncbi:MAG: hypothetical protein V4489_09170 [Chlamydiota bacterium]